jgi:hypothetical protein
MIPNRVQRKRVKDWRTPLDAQGRKAVYVGRGTRYGNPWVIARTNTLSGWSVNWANGPAPVGLNDSVPADNQRDAHAIAVELYETWVHSQFGLAERACDELAGRDLMCWCSEELPCHVDVLLRIVNAVSG